MDTMAYLFLGLVLIMFLLFVVLVRLLKKRSNQMLVQFYKQCDDDVRDEIHKATSKAEIAEIARDLEHVEDTFIHELPESVTQKELNLLYKLLEKKTKKLN